MRVFIAAHKLFKTKPSYNEYVPINTGAAFHPDLPYIRDNTGDNISLKNKSYCELTALYWAWKNTSDDISGLVHYRRYFVTWTGYVLKLLTGKNCCFLSPKQIRQGLGKCDIIVSTISHDWNKKMPIIDSFSISHNRRDMLAAREGISELFPEYLQTFDDVIMTGELFYPANMFIARREILESYCAWLFPVLQYVEDRIDISAYDDYQKRVFGFISERLLYVWIRHNNLRVMERHVINTEDRSVFGMLFNLIKNGKIR